MPEGPEVEMERLHETIKEEAEHRHSAFLRQIALTTAIFAAVAAVVSLQAGSTVNEALVLKTEATRLQAEASDQWAFYQAKGIKAAIQQASRTSWLALGKTAPPEQEERQKRYVEEQAEIKKKAQEIERERDVKSREADHLLHQHHGFADSVAILQVSIALGAVAALTRNRMVWIGSLIGGTGGLILGLVTFLH